ncbi:xanthine dehydrogenase family protein subunit M [Actibacterium sp. MT2.3-13A]|uniref:FAD binding domain-containing protein n=1 Tax=Actibacterium sp. MT2.3-13A TaxID=2828332 RepID=UPI001BA7A777|nr:xanthine dehydrogenase family protein subunit M [Actibacterium sp. MT2.3-13A]
MKPAPFTYHRPASVREALELLARYGADAKPVSGGQSLGPMLNMRLARPAHLVDLNDLLELDYVRNTGGVIEIGGLTRHHRVASAPEIGRDLPLLAEAAATIGHYAIRQRGTLGGSLVHADPAAQLPLVAVTLGAEVVLRSAKGERSVPADEFVQSIMTVDLADDEIVTAVRFPQQLADEGSAFDLFSRRHGDFAIVSVALTLRLDPAGAICALRLGLGGVGPVPQRQTGVEQEAIGCLPDAETAARLARAAAAAITPEDHPQVPAAYRRELVETLTARAFLRAAKRAGVTA